MDSPDVGLQFVFQSQYPKHVSCAVRFTFVNELQLGSHEIHLYLFLC